jgi:hypothetical protein
VSHIPSADPSLWPGQWPAEDGGPRRSQTVAGAGLGVADGRRLETTAVRDAVGTTMVVLRAPGEVLVLRHTLGRRPLRDPARAWVERIDPRTLQPLARTPLLAAGPFWPGGLAAHADGTLHVVAGDHAHRLSPDLEVLRSVRLPAPRPYNSFVVLPDGTLVTKDLDRTLAHESRLVVVDPALEPRCAPVGLGEPAIARLSADGDTIYVVGARTVSRWHWDGAGLERDPDWGGPYLSPAGSYGWDPVVADGHLWFLDNGEHDFVTTMRGAGVAPGPVHLVRVALHGGAPIERVAVCGLPRGAVTDPPLVDPERGVVVAYDSANGVVQAFTTTGLEPLWRRHLSHAAHMLLFAETGELVLHDFHGPAIGRTRVGRALGRRATPLLRSRRLRAAAARGSRDEVVVLDVLTGEEHGRAAVPSAVQSVVFPAPGFDRDLYWVTMTTIARVAAR